MKDWKDKIEKKKRKGSQTAGKDKGENCTASPMKKYFAKRSRSYKHPDYEDWLEWVRKVNGDR
jgi:hypothetical protein